MKDVKIDMPYQRWFHPASPFTQEGLKTQHPFTKPFERPEMKELFAILRGKVRTVRSSGSIFYGNLSPNKNQDFLLDVQHLFLSDLDVMPPEGELFHSIWKYFVKNWLIKNKEMNGNHPRFFFKMIKVLDQLLMPINF